MQKLLAFVLTPVVLVLFAWMLYGPTAQSDGAGPSFVYRFDADASGNHRVPALPVGAVQLRRREDNRTHVERWRPIADFVIKAGQHVQVTPQ